MEKQPETEPYQELFNYLSNEHGVTLLQTDLQAIERIVLSSQKIEAQQVAGMSELIGLKFSDNAIKGFIDGYYANETHIKGMPNTGIAWAKWMKNEIINLIENEKSK